MKGEYQDSDGPQTCHQCKWWKRLEEGTRADAEGASRHGMCHFNPERYPTDPGHHCSQFAAKAALDALIEEEQERAEWTVDKFPYRAKQDGSSMQWLAGGVWRDTNEFEQAAYRKGREVALEQVQELVRAVEEAHGMTTPLGFSYVATIKSGNWDRIRDLARAVKS